MARDEFDERFGYVLWIDHLLSGEPAGFAEIGRRVGKAAGRDRVSGQAVSGWLKRGEKPGTYDLAKALPLALGVTEGWLYEGKGDAPYPDLWRMWQRARSRPIRKWSGGLLPPTLPEIADDRRRGEAR